MAGAVNYRNTVQLKPGAAIRNKLAIITSEERIGCWLGNCGETVLQQFLCQVLVPLCVFVEGAVVAQLLRAESASKGGW